MNERAEQLPAVMQIRKIEAIISEEILRTDTNLVLLSVVGAHVTI